MFKNFKIKKGAIWGYVAGMLAGYLITIAFVNENIKAEVGMICIALMGFFSFIKTDFDSEKNK